MVALIDTSKEAACDAAMRNMFAARKEVFVDLLGWDVPVLDGRFELDHLDDKHARYLILANSSHAHLGSARLLPTTRPHLLDHLFPQLCAGPVPKGPTTYEITRFCLDRGLSAPRRREIRDRLVTALVTFALANGIGTYTGVAELPWLRQILQFGWDAIPLGEPMESGGKLLGALRIDITSDTKAQLTATGIWLPTEQMASSAAQPAHA